MDELLRQMRGFIMATDSHLLEEQPAPAPIAETAMTAPTSLLSDLSEVVFKLRAFMESRDGEYALGVETGMQRAADMIDNLIRRHTCRGE